MRKRLTLFLASLICTAMWTGPTAAQQREEVLIPYQGPSDPTLDSRTLDGRVMVGYQGWFNCEGDGADLGWTHWAKRREQQFAPGNIGVDLWPDVSEFEDAGELYATGFHFPDGTPAKVFSSHDRETVLRHFQWMRDYGIDGAFVQRFANGLKDENLRDHKDKVLSSAREGANRFGRTYCVMYDLSGIRDEQTPDVFADWRMLRDRMQINQDPAYQHHRGKPLVAIWGVGFSDPHKSRPDLQHCQELIQQFKADGCSVMLGVPTGWREQVRDASRDSNLHAVLGLADVISPWSVGRFADLAGVDRHADQFWQPDVVRTAERDQDYMPVIFPGFSWHHLKGDQLDAIPRLKGQFMWSQVVASKRAGCQMLYIAMFDEVDEGTAIFKCSPGPPTQGDTPFLDFGDLPSDHYLRIAEQAGKLYRDEIPVKETLPARLP
ncbi:MAG: glycoside hydrolase family 71/99-like protein [Planctomycetota bacterium]